MTEITFPNSTTSSTIMGSTETTIYTMTVLFGSVNIKKVRGTLIAGLIADITAIIMSIIVVNMGFF